MYKHMIKYMAVAVAVAVSGGGAVAVAVAVADLTQRFFNNIQKYVLIVGVMSFPFHNRQCALENMFCVRNMWCFQKTFCHL